MEDSQKNIKPIPKTISEKIQRRKELLTELYRLCDGNPDKSIRLLLFDRVDPIYAFQDYNLAFSYLRHGAYIQPLNTDTPSHCQLSQKGIDEYEQGFPTIDPKSVEKIQSVSSYFQYFK